MIYKCQRCGHRFWRKSKLENGFCEHCRFVVRYIDLCNVSSLSINCDNGNGYSFKGRCSDIDTFAVVQGFGDSGVVLFEMNNNLDFVSGDCHNNGSSNSNSNSNSYDSCDSSSSSSSYDSSSYDSCDSSCVCGCD